MAAAKRVFFAQLMVRVGTEDVPYLEGVMRHPGQEQIHFGDWSRFVANWGRRTGKTIAAAAEVMWTLSQPLTRTWIVAPSYDLTDRVFEYVYNWCIEDKILDAICGQEVIAGSSFPEKGPRYIKTRHRSSVKCRSAESINNIGDQLNLVVLDEAARIPRNVWEGDLHATLTDRKGKALFTSTPRGQNYFFEYHERGETPRYVATGWQSSTFATWDNPFIDPAYVREQEQELPPDVFRREFGASFEHFTGLILPEFRDLAFDFNEPGTGGHLFSPRRLELPLNSMTVYRGGDVGSEHPTVWLWAAVGALNIGEMQGHPDDLWVFRGYFGKPGSSHVEHAKACASCESGLKVYDGWISPDAARKHRVNEGQEDRSIDDVYREHGLYCRAANDDVKYGIDVMRTYLRSTLEASPSHGRIFISEDLPELRNCLKNYVWQEPAAFRPGKERDSPERPRKYKDDAADALRYLTATEPRAVSAFFRKDDKPPRYGTPDMPAQKRASRSNVRIMGGLYG